MVVCQTSKRIIDYEYLTFSPADPMNRFYLIVSLLSGLSLCSAFADTWIEPPLTTEKGYPVPQPDTPPVVPSAHGAHPAYAIEWWYWVGHLEAVDGSEAFGFQSTVFRVAGDPKKDLTRGVPGMPAKSSCI
jgi:predicted secreted hydrolase